MEQDNKNRIVPFVHIRVENAEQARNVVARVYQIERGNYWQAFNSFSLVPAAYHVQNGERLQVDIGNPSQFRWIVGRVAPPPIFPVLPGTRLSPRESAMILFQTMRASSEEDMDPVLLQRWLNRRVFQVGEVRLNDLFTFDSASRTVFEFELRGITGEQAILIAQAIRRARYQSLRIETSYLVRDIHSGCDASKDELLVGKRKK